MRLEITRRADLAVRALAVLGRSEGRMKSAALAHELGTTTAFVPQVAAPLVKAGWVTSEPGPTGGYRCVIPLDDVSVLDVIEAVDGATETGCCVVADRPCGSGAPCTLHVAWATARGGLMRSLAAFPVADVPEAIAS